VAPLRTISNSVVKRYSGENSWRVASCKDSSMPGLYFNNKESPSHYEVGILCCDDEYRSGLVLYFSAGLVVIMRIDKSYDWVYHFWLDRQNSDSCHYI
jgi:hypothetical protein